MNKPPIEKKLYAQRFDRDHAQRNALWKVLCSNFFQKYINTQDIVLDVATGYGEFINNISCKKKLACDINPDSKKYLDNNVQFLKSSSSKIPLKNNSVDKIFISNFFEHITREEILSTIHELHRLLKPGGNVLVLQPNIRYCAKDYWMFFDHITPIDDRALTEVFSMNGFALQKKIERFLPFTTKSKFPKSPFFVKVYLSLPFLWRIFGKQSFLVYEKV